MMLNVACLVDILQMCEYLQINKYRDVIYHLKNATMSISETLIIGL